MLINNTTIGWDHDNVLFSITYNCIIFVVYSYLIECFVAAITIANYILEPCQRHIVKDLNEMEVEERILALSFMYARLKKLVSESNFCS